MKKFTRGFTLIELLVVIAIIGILASIVLVSLNGARKKGGDARVISDVQQLRTTFETDFNGSSYPDFSGAGSNQWVQTASSTVVNTLVADAASNGGSITVWTTGSPVTAYAVFGALPSQSGSKYFCLTSTGSTSQQAAAATGINSCQ